jgi:hypothetical protein
MMSWVEPASAVLGQEKKRMSLVMHNKALSLFFFQKQILKNFVSFSISIQFEPTG